MTPPGDISAAAPPATPRTRPQVVGWWKECVEAWPECFEGGYHPGCCRFPKSCSCAVLDYELHKAKPGDVVLFPVTSNEQTPPGAVSVAPSADAIRAEMLSGLLSTIEIGLVCHLDHPVLSCNEGIEQKCFTCEALTAAEAVRGLLHLADIAGHGKRSCPQCSDGTIDADDWCSGCGLDWKLYGPHLGGAS